MRIFRSFCSIVIGDILADSPTDMARVELNDGEPGTPPEVRHVPGGSLTLVFTIAADYKARTRDQLILTSEPEGQLFAALAREPADPEQ